jgi:hypothetical protein
MSFYVFSLNVMSLFADSSFFVFIGINIKCVLESDMYLSISMNIFYFSKKIK